MANPTPPPDECEWCGRDFPHPLRDCIEDAPVDRLRQLASELIDEVEELHFKVGTLQEVSGDPT